MRAGDQGCAELDVAIAREPGALEQRQATCGKFRETLIDGCRSFFLEAVRVRAAFRRSMETIRGRVVIHAPRSQAPSFQHCAGDDGASIDRLLKLERLACEERRSALERARLYFLVEGYTARTQSEFRRAREADAQSKTLLRLLAQEAQKALTSVS